jgi:alanine-alpha-ketoisovalerate/valine-pyruvate aminotransferase
MEEKRQKYVHNGIKEAAFMQVITLLDKLERGIDILYYLMENGKEKSFVVALVSAQNIPLEAHIIEQKRETDLLFEINKERNLYALLCQGTEVDGGYYFIKRLVKTIQEKGGKDVYCSEIDVQNTNHPIQEIVFRLLNMYSRVKAEKADGKISFHSLAR